MFTKMKRIVSFLFALTILAAAMLAVATPAKAYPTYKMINVEKIKQPKSMLCWAACGASIVNHTKGTDLSAKSFAILAQGHYGDNARPLTTIQTYLSSKFSTLSAYYKNAYTVDWDFMIVASNSAMSFNTVASNIWSNHPLLVGTYVIREVYGHRMLLGHAVLLCGYEQSGRYLWYMDPANASYQRTSYNSFVMSGNKFWGDSLYNVR